MKDKNQGCECSSIDYCDHCLKGMAASEPTAAMQAAGASVIRFDTTPINKIYTANAVYRAMHALAPDTATAADYEDVLTDHRRLVRELDVLLNGENAAQQASLCDIVAQVRSEKERPAPDVDEYAYDLARQIMQLVAKTHVGGVTQLQAKIQCLIAETAAPATAPAPDWSMSERRDCVTCGSEGVSTLHYNGEPVCESCYPPKAGR